MFGIRRGKLMAAVIAGDKIKIIDRRWANRGEQRGLARTRNRTGRQAAPLIRVIRRIGLQINARQVAVKILDAVNHGRIAVQFHADAQAIMIDRRNQFALLRQPRLFLDN